MTNMETHYNWLPINEVGDKRLVKDLGLQMRCKACDAVLIDRTGKKRTKEVIWQYGISGHVLGHAHQSCTYMVEVKGIEANTPDTNFGKAPNEWV